MDKGLHNLLRSLTRAEIKELKKAAECRVFNYNKNVTELLRVMLKYYPTIKEEILTEEKLYNIIYRNSNYKPGTMRNLFFRAHKLVEEFLIFYRVRKSKTIRTEVLMKIFDEKKLNNQHRALSQKRENYFNNRKKFDRMDYLHKSNFRNNEYDHLKHRDKILDKDIAKKHIEILTDGDNLLTAFYVTELIIDSLIIDATKKKYYLSKQRNKTKDILKIINVNRLVKLLKKESEENFLALLYLSSFNMFRKFRDEKLYDDYKKEFEKYKNRLEVSEFTYHHNQLVNYCILKEKDEKNLDKFGQERLGLYKMITDNDYYKLQNLDYMQDSIFRAIVLLNYRLGDVTGLKKFIDKNKKKLSPASRENMEQYAESYFYYLKGDYDNALINISYLEFTDFIYRYDVYNLKLKILYDTGDLNAACHLIDTYRHFVHNNDMLEPERKLMHRNFIRYVTKLIKYYDNEKKLDETFRNFENEKNILYKDWLRRRWMKIGKVRQNVH